MVTEEHFQTVLEISKVSTMYGIGIGRFGSNCSGYFPISKMAYPTLFLIYQKEGKRNRVHIKSRFYRKIRWVGGGIPMINIRL